MNKAIEVLDALPVTTIAFVLAAAGGVYCLVTGSIDYHDFLVGLGITGAGTAAVGHVRNTAGKGLAHPGRTKRTGTRP